MTHDQKVAIARIVSDLIKADNVIEVKEMIALAKIDEEYKIRPEHKVEAQRCSFSMALNQLKDSLTKKEKSELLEILSSLSKADDSCVPREALLLLAIKYSFDFETKNLVNTFACDLKNSTLNDFFVVYVESEYDEEYNEELEENFDDICDILSNCGFDFVYMPRLGKELENMNEDYVKNVITYMAPHLLCSEGCPDNMERIQALYDELLHIDTGKFCRNLLYKTIGIKEISDIEPSILINIGTSLEPYCGHETKIYTEFLSITLQDSLKKEVRKFTNDFRKTISIPPTPKNRFGMGETFKYFGFYKALFDIVVFGKEKQTTPVIIDFDDHNIKFPGQNIPVLKLNNKQLATYALVLEESLCKKIGGLRRDDDEKLRTKLNRIFVYFYDHGFQSARENCDYFKGLNVSISNIRKQIRTQFAGMDNLEMYVPEDAEGDIYKTRIDPELVFVKEKGEIKPIVEHFAGLKL